jgi:DNA-directed RNA polymerase specialized sigma24 family protein
VVIREFADIIREARRKNTAVEIPMSGLNEAEARKVENLSVAYDPAVFLVEDYEITIENDILADGLLRLTDRQRNIILLAVCCGESDKMIADRLSMPRSTVQYQRGKTITEMRERMERINNEGIQA